MGRHLRTRMLSLLGLQMMWREQRSMCQRLWKKIEPLDEKRQTKRTITGVMIKSILISSSTCTSESKVGHLRNMILRGAKRQRRFGCKGLRQYVCCRPAYPILKAVYTFVLYTQASARK